MNRSEELLDLASTFLSESDIHAVCAFASGSVGRGTADNYSDIDLIIFTDEAVATRNIDQRYRGEIIQLELLSIKEIPNKEEIMALPWDFRFLTEMSIIKDHEGQLNDLKEWAANFYHSENGRKKMFGQVSAIVKERKEFTSACLKKKRYYSATIAALGAWAEAALLYTFLKTASLSTDLLIPQIQKLDGHMEKFLCVSPFSLDTDVSKGVKIVSCFRSYLRGHQKTPEFYLSEIQDALLIGKAERLLIKNERLNLLWQMYGEALWLFFETANGQLFEDVFEKLPPELKSGLSQLGFVPLEALKVEGLCKLSEELFDLSSRLWIEGGV